MTERKQLVGVIAQNSDGHYLLQKRDKHVKIYPLEWGIFGGHVDDSETPLEAAVREFKEETSVNLDVSDLEKVLTIRVDEPSLEFHVFQSGKNVEANQIVLTEGEGFCFFPIEEVRQLKLAGYTRELIETVQG